MLEDIHIIKYFSSFISVSRGQVVYVTDPQMSYCPLAQYLHKEIKIADLQNKEEVKGAIKGVIEKKIRDYGFFTSSRQFSFSDVNVPYGASEMMMFALQKEVVDTAVTVCDGAGTVVVSSPQIMQGIGAYMNSLLMTSPIKAVMSRLKDFGCQIVFDNAVIEQVRGVREAINAGHKRIAVTVLGHNAPDLKLLRALEKEKNIKLIILVVCTTGISREHACLIRDYANLVWSCASTEVRQIVGVVAKLQVSCQIPVFVLTDEGVRFVSAYAQDPQLLKDLDTSKQYLISKERIGTRVKMGDFNASISEAVLPVSARRTPTFAQSCVGQ